MAHIVGLSYSFYVINAGYNSGAKQVENIMKIEIKDSGNSVSIVVVGDIEMMTIKEFKEKLFEIGQNTDKDVELDLSNVDYIDSSGVGVLISLMKLQKKKGKNFKITKVSSQVMNVLQLSSLSEVFNL